jgi:hypothetical protein
MNESLKFADWLLINCTIKVVLYSSNVGYYWTLNTDYENSWDGSDVKRYTTEQIYSRL